MGKYYSLVRLYSSHDGSHDGHECSYDRNLQQIVLKNAVTKMQVLNDCVIFRRSKENVRHQYEHQMSLKNRGAQMRIILSNNFTKRS